MDIQSIYRDYYRFIYNYALKLTCHPEDALDLTQDTFLAAMEKLNTLKKEEALAGWLRTICYHGFLDRAMRDKKKYLYEEEDWEQLEQLGRQIVADEPTPEEEVVVEEEIKELQNGCFLAMVRKLTLHQRIAFSLADMYGMKIGDIAELLGISVNAAKGLLYRARMNIDSFFDDHCNLIYEENPCSCKAWIGFSEKRDGLQKKTKKLIERLDYEKKDYRYDETVRRRVYTLYRRMPDRKPPEEWYHRFFQILEGR